MVKFLACYFLVAVFVNVFDAKYLPQNFEFPLFPDSQDEEFRLQKFYEDIPDINSEHMGYYDLDDLTGNIVLKYGMARRLHYQKDLLYVMKRKSILLDILAIDLGLKVCNLIAFTRYSRIRNTIFEVSCFSFITHLNL